MNTLFIVKVEILVVIKWSYRPRSLITFIVEPRLVITFSACSLISFNHVSLLVFVFGAWPNHIPLRYNVHLGILDMPTFR